jgi:apolipoprotein D and lipocalin family protein
VRDAGGGARLVEEHLDELSLRGEVRVEALDGDGAREPGGSGETPEVHGGHAAGADDAVERVPSEDARAGVIDAHGSSIHPRFLTVGLLVLVVLVAIQLVGCSQGPPLDVAANVDLGRVEGKWYEIAKLPRATQADCFATTAFYTRTADGLDVVNACHTGSVDGPMKTLSMSARTIDARTPAKLGLDIHGFFGDFWILEVGEAYEYMAIGHPSRAYLWIMSRTPKMDPAMLDGVVHRLGEKQFDTGKLEYTAH